MDPLPPEVLRRLEALEGASVLLVYDAFAPDEGRALLVLMKPSQPVLHVIVYGVNDASWGFARPPALRVQWRFASPLRAVSLSVVHLFDRDASTALPGQSLRREPLAHAVRPPSPARGVAVTASSLGVVMHGVPSVPLPVRAPADRAMRVELRFDGDAPLSLEGTGVTLGPVPSPGRTLGPGSSPNDPSDPSGLPPLPSWGGGRGPALPS